MGQFFIPRSRIRCVLPIKADTGKGCQVTHLYQHKNSEHLLHIAVDRVKTYYTIYTLLCETDYLYPPYFVFINGDYFLIFYFY